MNRKFHFWMLRTTTDDLAVLHRATCLFLEGDIEKTPEETETAGCLLRDLRSVLAKRAARSKTKEV